MRRHWNKPPSTTAALIAARLSQPVTNEVVETDYQRIDNNQVETSHARRIKAETLRPCMRSRQLQLDEKLVELNGNEVAAQREGEVDTRCAINLKGNGIHLSWESIRHIIATQQRVTLALPTPPM